MGEKKTEGKKPEEVKKEVEKKVVEKKETQKTTSKTKGKLKEFGEKFKSIFSKYPVTMIVVILLTLFMAFVYEENGIFGWFDTSKYIPIISKEMMNKILMFGFTYAISALFIEVLVKKEKKTFKTIGLLVMAAVDIGIIMAIEHFGKKGVGYNDKFILDWIDRYYVMYLLTMVVVIIHKSFKSMETTIEEYLSKIVVNMLKIGIIYGVLSLGVLAISYGLMVALLEIDEVIVLRIETLLFGLFFVPQVINALFDKDVTIGKFAKVMIRYVLQPLYICALVILYLYFIKIFVTHNMPKNILFSIITSMFGCGFIIWTLNDYFKDDTMLYKVNKYLPIAFLPAVVMQAYCMAIRLMDYSMTVMRYAGIMVIVFETIYCLVYIIKKDKVERLLFVGLILTAISVICPFINASNIARLSQNDILKEYVEAGKPLKEYSIENIRTIQGAYSYLDDDFRGTELINKTLTEEQKEDIKSVNIVYDYKNEEYKISGQKDNATSDYSKTSYITCKDNKNAVDVSEYNILYEMNQERDYGVRMSVKDTFESVTISSYNDDQELENECTVDLSELAQYIVDNYDEEYNETIEYFNENNEIELNDNRKIIITKLYIEYLPDSKLVYCYTIDSLLLEK